MKQAMNTLLGLILISVSPGAFAEEESAPPPTEHQRSAARAVLLNDSCTRQLMEFCSKASAGEGDLAACVQLNRARFSKLCVTPPESLGAEEAEPGEPLLTFIARGGYVNQDFKNQPGSSGSGPGGGIGLILDHSLVQLRPEFSFLNVSSPSNRADKSWTKFTASARVLVAVLHEFDSQSRDQESYEKLMAGLGYELKVPILGKITPSAGYARLTTDLSVATPVDYTGFYGGISSSGQNLGLRHELRFSYASAKAGSLSDPTGFFNVHVRLFYGFGRGLRFGPEATLDREAYGLATDTLVRIGLRIEI